MGTGGGAWEITRLWVVSIPDSISVSFGDGGSGGFGGKSTLEKRETAAKKI